MAEVSPFRGILYNPAIVQLETVLAPPYDVISPRLQLELYGRALQNVVRVELGRDFESDVPGVRDRYTRARDHIRVWREQAVLVEDAQPSVYVHRHGFRPPGGGGPRERLGCFVGVEPVPHERREVLRHELTLTAPREDRLRLLRATAVLSSPVFLLYEDSSEVTSEMERVTSEGQPFAEAVVDGEYGTERHQLWRVSDPETVARVTGGLSRARLFIADGHHRYETALSLRLHRFLALASPLDDPGNVILPTHRVVPDANKGVVELTESLTARGWCSEAADGVGAAVQKVAGLREAAHAFAIVGSDGMTVASRPRQSGDGGSVRLALDVSVLENEILGPLLEIDAGDAEAARLLYTRDPEEALELALANRGVSFLLNPPTVTEMAAVAVAGEAMPQKSTYFFPKVPAGLVFMSTQ